MKKRAKENREAVRTFDITEVPLRLYGWKPENGHRYLEIIEQDVRSLTRQVAEARFALAEDEQRHCKETRELLMSVLGTVDAFERVFRNIDQAKDAITPQCNKWINAFRSVYRVLRVTLKEHGVVEMEKCDEGFDPQWHQITGKVFDPNRPEGAIVEQDEKGYLWRNQLLRKAKLIVVSHDEEDSIESSETPDAVPATSLSEPAKIEEHEGAGISELPPEA